ncbi:hypothetical protein CH380_14155 [Leptospira adleri]|uniref:Uncharacterized protein n=1 Tax=Leptospira adleri TaxID=2023186 RepID=A0A2M9YMD6_9LEPT|nr:hypothetical protein CH380_14155 [Leptospira adleri]PJZ60027.1 hypothetical protein CH376_20510 [Leptospira adleri]
MIASYFLFPKNFFCTKKNPDFLLERSAKRAQTILQNLRFERKNFTFFLKKLLTWGGIEIRNRVIKMEHSKS